MTVKKYIRVGLGQGEPEMAAGRSAIISNSTTSSDPNAILELQKINAEIIHLNIHSLKIIESCI